MTVLDCWPGSCDLLYRRWLTNSGLFAKEFEQRIASFLGVKHCIVVCERHRGAGDRHSRLGQPGDVITVPAPMRIEVEYWKLLPGCSSMPRYTFTTIRD